VRKKANPGLEEACVANRNDDIWIDVFGLNSWLEQEKASGKAPKDASVRDLVPFLNHVPLRDVHPFGKLEFDDFKTKKPVVCIGFTLAQRDSSRTAWLHLLNQPVLKRQMALSVGLENGDEMDSYLAAGAPEPWNQFFLTVI